VIGSVNILFDGVIRRKLCSDISKCGFAIDFYVNAIGVSVNGQFQVIYVTVFFFR